MWKILIVDDEPKIRRGLRKWIEEFDFKFQVVGEAGDYKEALDMAEKYNPDVFLMDINMPMINGLDLTNQLKYRYPNSYTIIISGYDDFEYALRALKLKVFDYLLKPIPKTDLYNVLKALNIELSSLGEYKQRDNGDIYNMEASNLSAIVLRVKRYIEENYSDMDLSPSKVASLFNINKNYLSTLMKDQLGYSFIEYMTKVRILKAKELLTDDILYPNISEIAKKVGFKSQHYFSRVFKNKEGISPIEYRNKFT
ncbi:AraC family two component transcriptional regulator [Tissierella praeacuta]|uniref:response regulator transcription factor n=1 Tax=Tissierella praeacuta TaxID=43131 RepID=UPI0010E519E3|nr:response regulator [Tissierella praeacuta]TCU77379.1 AraC family two component transcriptional regulator [Tissierella praeacuta]